MRDSLELAHKLSLIQRNLQMAQTAIDSAEEFLQQVIDSLDMDVPNFPSRAPVQQPALLPAPPVESHPVQHHGRGRAKDFTPAPPPAKRPFKKRGRPKKTGNGGATLGPVGQAVKDAINGQDGKTEIDYGLLEQLLKNTGVKFTRQQMRDAANNLVIRGQIKRIGPGVFAKPRGEGSVSVRAGG